MIIGFGRPVGRSVVQEGIIIGNLDKLMNPAHASTCHAEMLIKKRMLSLANQPLTPFVGKMYCLLDWIGLN